MSNSLTIEIAGIAFALSCKNAVILQPPGPNYHSFLKKENKSPEAIKIEIRPVDKNMPGTKKMSQIFDSERSWSMFRDTDNYCLVLQPPVFQQPLCIAWMNHDFTRITLYYDEKLIYDRERNLTISNPVLYPLDQILLMCFLAKREGVLIHAAGIGFNGKGYIFAGKSGAGKSTLSRQFTHRDSLLLSDDRIVVRKISDAFKAFGTPWPGDAGIAANKGVSLSGMFFLSHGSSNRIEKIKPQEALEKLLPVTSIPWYDQEMMTQSLVFCEELISRIPAYNLDFKPDTEVVDVLEEFLS